MGFRLQLQAQHGLFSMNVAQNFSRLVFALPQIALLIDPSLLTERLSVTVEYVGCLGDQHPRDTPRTDSPFAVHWLRYSL